MNKSRKVKEIEENSHEIEKSSTNVQESEI